MNGITVIDDYAHHPVEIEATIDAARQFHNNRLIVIFSPTAIPYPAAGFSVPRGVSRLGRGYHY